MSLAFDFRDQLNAPWETAGPALIEGLDRLYAALGPVTNTSDSVTTSGVTNVTAAWVSVPFDASMFTTNSTGSITASGNAPYAVLYKIIGSTMWLNVAFTATINNPTTTEVRVRVPGNVTLAGLPAIGSFSADEDRQRTAGVWNGGVTAGVAGIFVDISDKLISIQRWDGVAAAGFPNGQACFFGFMVAIPLAGS